MKNKIKEILGRHGRPMIGIVGAASLVEGYDNTEAYRLGYGLRKAIGNKGSLFTGGMPGVSSDFYCGISDFCSENSLEDRFFVLLPNNIKPFPVYTELAEKLKSKKLS